MSTTALEIPPLTIYLDPVERNRQRDVDAHRTGSVTAVRPVAARGMLR